MGNVFRSFSYKEKERSDVMSDDFKEYEQIV